MSNVIIQFGFCALNVAFAVQGGKYAWLSWAAAVFLFGLVFTQSQWRSNMMIANAEVSREDIGKRL